MTTRENLERRRVLLNEASGVLTELFACTPAFPFTKRNKRRKAALERHRELMRQIKSLEAAPDA